jgi:hypothetical protein
MIRIAFLWAWSTVAQAGGPVTLLEKQAAPQATVVFEAKQPGVKIGLVQHTDTTRAANAVVVEKQYDALCEAPCSFALDAGWHEFYFSYKRREWSKKLEVVPGSQRLFVRPMTPAGTAGAAITYFSGFLLFPVGVPLWVGGGYRHKIEPLEQGPVLVGMES